MSDLDAERRANCRQRFVAFSANGLDNHPERAAFLEHLSSEWSKRTSAQQRYVLEGLDEYESGFQQFAGLVETALSLRLGAPGQGNRRKTLEALNGSRDTLLSLIDVHRENAEILEDFRQSRIVQLSFSEHISRRFETRVAEMRAEADLYFKQIVDIETAIKMLNHEFDKDEPILEGNWYPVKTLSDRSANTAHLWVDVDPKTMEIRNRLVRKDTAIEKATLKDGSRWVSNGNTPRNGLPMEYYLQRKLSNLPGSRFIGEARKCEVDLGKLIYRLYLPYHQYGDLAGLILRYIADNSLIPEPFLWRIFEALIENGLLMERGGVQNAREEWQEIVHLDLKPDNVFLGVQESAWPQYPTPKLGDFGLAIQTNTYDPLNPSKYSGGTPGFRAPEQFFIGGSAGGLGRPQLLAHTNVFGVGAIMWSLANRTLCYDPKLDSLGRTRTIAGDHTGKLSSTLMLLIQDCMEFKIENRKTFAELKRALRNKVRATANDGDVFEYIANAQLGQQSKEAKFELLDFVYSEYQVGLALWAT